MNLKPKKSLSAKKVFEDLEYKEKWIATMKEKVWENDEWKKGQSERSKKSQNRPEVIEKHKNNTKELWKDPEFRKKAMENRPSKKVPYLLIDKENKIVREYESRDELSTKEKISLHIIRALVKENIFINCDEYSNKKKEKLSKLNGLKIIKKEDYETK
jgi:hypothetical protein